jgi:hypothetical protein
MVANVGDSMAVLVDLSRWVAGMFTLRGCAAAAAAGAVCELVSYTFKQVLRQWRWGQHGGLCNSSGGSSRSCSSIVKHFVTHIQQVGERAVR